MKTALLFSISMLTVNNAIAKCDCSSTPEFQKRNCNKVGEGEDPETKDKCHTFGGKWVLPPKEEPTQCTKFSAVEGEAASANAGFSCCNNMKIGQEGDKVPKCGYFESGQCKPRYTPDGGKAFSKEEKGRNLCSCKSAGEDKSLCIGCKGIGYGSFWFKGQCLWRDPGSDIETPASHACNPDSFEQLLVEPPSKPSCSWCTVKDDGKLDCTKEIATKDYSNDGIAQYTDAQSHDLKNARFKERTTLRGNK